MARPGNTGTPAKPKRRKPEKRCAECSKTFVTRSKHTLHMLAHEAAEETEMSVAEAEDELRELQSKGLLHRTHDGYIIEDEEPDA